MQRKKIDFLVTVLLLVIGAVISFYFDPSNPIVYLLYLGIPSLFLIIREKKNYKKILWGVGVFGALMGGVFDFVAKLNNAWIFTKPMFPNILIDGWLVENVLAYVFMTLFVIVFYEHFLDDERHARLSKSHSKIFLFLLLVIFIVFSLHTFNPIVLDISYFYLKAGLAAIVFPVLFAFFNPKIIKKFAPLAVFFFFVWLVSEYIGLHNGNWTFPATHQYLGSVNLLGVHFLLKKFSFGSCGTQL
ncbi:MAG: hypothetical protein Q7K26_05580 [bacterium]|nr:hypothetical protein [bacterium]